MAAKFARQQNAGDSIAWALNHQAPAPLRNHARDNIKAMREKDRQLRGKRIMESQAQAQPAQVFKMKQFENAKSRVLSESRLPRHTPAAVEHRGQRSCTPHGSEKAGDDGENEMSLAEFEALADRMMQEHGKDAVKKTSFEKEASGCPVYLRKIKANIAEERSKDEARNVVPDAPAGCRVLPDEEVAETLGALKQKRDELEKEFQKLPLQIQTDSQKRRQKIVLDKIEESDKAIKLFSQPKVVVRD